ncbi:hypothetical protein Rctr197k_019 [Virus Rctr197k]|nr:hypothetical protein Rctr197k_019 [Virus Rctr197k]
MIQAHIADAAKAVLLKHLAPERAEEAAEEIAATAGSNVMQSIAAALAEALGTGTGTGSPPPAGKKTRAAKTTPAAPKKARAAQVAAPAAAKAKKETVRNLSDEARKVMSFKKAAYHAQRRQTAGTPEPWDAAILAAHAEGKILNVERIKRQALSAAKKTDTAAAAPAAPPAKGKAKKAANGTLANAAPL